jgi:hypothetical protein
VGTDLDGPLTGALALGARFAGSAQVRGCLTEQLVAYSLGVRPDEVDDCNAQDLRLRVEATGGRLGQILAVIAESDLARSRQP